MCNGIIIDAHLIPKIRCDLTNGSGTLYDILYWIVNNCGIAMTQYIENHWYTKCKDGDVFWEWYRAQLEEGKNKVHYHRQLKTLDNRAAKSIRNHYGLNNSHIKACIVCANTTNEPRYILTEHIFFYNPKLKNAPPKTKDKIMEGRSGRLCRYLQRNLNIRVGTRTDCIKHFSINHSHCSNGQPCPHLPNC